MQELHEIKARYDRRTTNDARYVRLRPSVYMTVQERERAIIALIQEAGLEPLGDKTLLEVGCGTGGNLLELMRLGFQPENMLANDLLPQRVADARRMLPETIKVLEGDASQLDLPHGSFDVLLQSTVFTSILDREFQHKLADHMWALLKEGGGIFWYDFVHDNPKNPDVKGVPLKRIKELFPEGNIISKRVTLAPPISRRVTKLHPQLYTFLNLFPFLRTHLLCWIEKPALRMQ